MYARLLTHWQVQADIVWSRCTVVPALSESYVRVTHHMEFNKSLLAPNLIQVTSLFNMWRTGSA